MYKVFDNEFASMQEVADWAWNTHKIEWDHERDPDDLPEEEKQKACRSLEKYVKLFEET